MHFSTTLISAAAFAQLSIAGYVLEDDFMTDFYGAFDFWDAPDPTSGFVQYVDRDTAQGMGLMNSTPGVVSWGVDATNLTPLGRPSIRMTSKKSYEHGLVVLDVAHMPTGCGTWPAFWMVGADWPNNGEIDILEGVNDQETNSMTLHTGAGCSIADGGFGGTVETQNCDVKALGQSENAGCSISHPSTDSYGAGLNAIGGGVYATQWTNDAISIWYFKRGSVPTDALGESPDPASWGEPVARFANSACNIENIFNAQQIVFDTTFCGYWAGNAWSSGSCASKAATCNEYVANNPSAFTEAGWTINALKVYQINDGAATSTLPASTTTPAATEAPTAPITTEVPITETISISTSTAVISAPYPSSNGINFTAAPFPTAVPSSSGGLLFTSVGSEVLGPEPSATAPVFGSSLAAPSVTQLPDEKEGVMSGFQYPSRTGKPDPSKVPGISINGTAPVASSAASTGSEMSTISPSSASASVTGVIVAPTSVAPVKVLDPTGTSVADHSFVAGMPTDMPGMEPAVTQVVHTVYDTVFVNVPYTPATSAPSLPITDTPVETPVAAHEAGSWRARHARQLRRRQTRHNHVV